MKSKLLTQIFTKFHASKLETKIDEEIESKRLKKLEMHDLKSSSIMPNL